MENRVEREKKAYDDQVINRSNYNKILYHTTHSYYSDYKKRVIINNLEYARGKKVLELGSTSWHSWLYGNKIVPEHTTCINISMAEIGKGVEWYEKTNKQMDVNFILTDANNLSFKEASFDFVFGFGILHHLHFDTALREVNRVLKPDGRILFYEPLGINPISKLIRMLTPQARTKDEKPLEYQELKILGDHFNTVKHYEQFISVPLGVISPFLFKNPKNPLTKLGYMIDRLIDKLLPALKPLYRFIIIEGGKN